MNLLTNYTKTELIEYLNKKYEALEFWEGIKSKVHIDKKIQTLETEIDKARKQLRSVV
jgi:hypothetical protein